MHCLKASPSEFCGCLELDLFSEAFSKHSIYYGSESCSDSFDTFIGILHSDKISEKSRFFNLVYYYLISAMFIPFSVLMLPLAVQANRFHIDNIYGIVLLYVLLGLPMNIFLYGGAIRATPEALDEAAKIDGATGLQTFFILFFQF